MYLYTRSFNAIFSAIILAQLTVACGDGSGPSADTAQQNNAPTASAGVDQTSTFGNNVFLDASNSFDSDGDGLSYQWTIDSAPKNSTASLNNSSNITTDFTPDKAGDYVISLVVNDGFKSSITDYVTVHSITRTQTPMNTERVYAIVDTNQTSCYNSSTGNSTPCTGLGHDADYTANQPSYSLSSDGQTVTDNITGLVWTQSSDINDDGVVDYDDKLFQPDAVSYCENLTIGGRSDWRLPSVKEAYSLILFSGKDASNYQGTDTSTLVPFLDSVFDWAFGDLDSASDRIIDGQYASTDLYVSTTMNGNSTMFGVNYVDGRIKGYPTTTKEYYVRCVTGNVSYGTNDFTDNSDQTISDNATGLMWQKDDSDSHHWDDAISQCESASTATYNDWRLPNVKELQSIVDYTVSPDSHDQAAINAIFNSSEIVNEEGEDDWGFYWSSTTHVDNDGDGSNATYVSFGRALGYMNSNILDVHGAGSQRSNDKVNVSTEPGAQSASGSDDIFYYKGPQGDILRTNNKVRCVRDISVEETVATSYTLFAPLPSKETYLIDDKFNTVHSWSSNYRPGLSVYLLNNGELLRTGSLTSKPTVFTGQYGGSAGVIEILNWDSDVIWSKTLATDAYLCHHDIELLPNGNILAIVWEAKSAADALALGRTQVSSDTLWADAVYEICRNSASNTCTDGEIVWRWSTWDHVIQDVYSTISNTYVTDINEHQNKVNLNYTNGSASPDWTHINAVDYNAETDEILLSVHNFNEYWVISHNDDSQGIIARVGNPAAYNGTGEQRLFVQHDTQWIESGLPGAGNILVFNNGSNRADGDYSSVDEFCYQNDNCTEGELINSYSEGASGDFYASRISGAQRLTNGNTLVCEGTEGRLFEYNESHDITWEYNYGSEIFRATRYEADYSGLNSLN